MQSGRTDAAWAQRLIVVRAGAFSHERGKSFLIGRAIVK
jgi:hypothetical protein